jgi:uncharacterized protein (DUF924 family)
MDILSFWFDEIEHNNWWSKDQAFDALIEQKFASIHCAAKRCELFEWRITAQGRLAEIIVLDQFSRNIYRDKPEAFVNDQLALALAQEAILMDADSELSEVQRSFLYMPLMHSESLAIHAAADMSFRRHTSESTYEFEKRHHEIIRRFGRYPHRNNILGRQSSPSEIEFLSRVGSSF